MSFSVYTAADPNIFTDAPNVVTVAAGVATLIFVNEQGSGREIFQRLIQNVGSNTCYYSENLLDNKGILNNPNPTPICDNQLNFHGMLLTGQQLDCSSHKQSVCVYSPNGTVISTTIRRRSGN